MKQHDELSSKGERRKKFRRRARGKNLSTTLELALEEVSSWTEECERPVEVVKEVGTLLVRPSGRVTPSELRPVIETFNKEALHHLEPQGAIPTERQGTRLNSADLYAAGYFLLRLISEKVRRTRREMVANEMMSVGIVDLARIDRVDEGLRWLFLLEYREVGQQWASEDNVRARAAYIPSMKATMLAERRDPAAVDRAFELYETSNRELAALEADNNEFAARYRAQTLNNIAQTYMERQEGDQGENLRRAVRWFERCLEHPARTSEPGAWLFSLQSWVMAVRRLAGICDNQDEALDLLQSAVSRAEEGLERLERENISFQSFDVDRLQRELWLAWANVRLQLLELEERDEARRKHCERVLDDFDEQFGEPNDVSIAAKMKFQRGARDSESVEWDEVAEVIRRLAYRLEAEQRPLQPEEAARCSMLLDRVFLREESDEEVSTERVPWEALSSVVNHIHPRATTVPCARQLVVSESKLLEPFRNGEPPFDGLETYLDEGRRTCLEGLASPELSHVHRRVLASRIRSLSLCCLAIMSESSPTERLAHWEASGAVAYRSDLFFWGRGPAEFVEEPVPASSHSSRGLHREEWWRGFTYDTRAGMDETEGHRAMMRMGQMYPNAFPAPSNIRERYESEVYETDPETGEVRVRTVSLKEGRRINRQRLEGLIERGRKEGFDIGADRSQHVHADELVRWLRDHRKTGVFLSAGPQQELFWADASGDIRQQRLDERLSGNQREHWENALKDVVEAQDRFMEGRPTGHSNESNAFGTSVESSLDSATHVTRGPPSDESASRLGEALETCFEAGSKLAQTLTDVAHREGLEQIAVLSRNRTSWIPWEYVQTNEHTLGEAVSIVRVPTLADASPNQRPTRRDTLTCVPMQASDDPTRLGARVFEGRGEIRGDMLGSEFARQAMNADVVRLFTHAMYNISPLDSRFLLYDSDETRRRAEANNRTTPGVNGWYAASDTKRLDLRGCRRVELWGCQSHLSRDEFGMFLGEDEPSGLAMAFLSAGAQRVVGAWWQKPVAPTALIAATFADRVSRARNVWEESSALASSIRSYRGAVEEGGIMASATLEYVTNHMDEADDPDALRRRAIAEGWSKSLQHLVGRSTAPPEDIEWTSYQGGFAEQTLGEQKLQDIRTSPERTVHEWLELWRSPMAWAGWRLTARDRSCLSGRDGKST
jgi:hypothetical protein